jgi:hypothetical protein
MLLRLADDRFAVNELGHGPGHLQSSKNSVAARRNRAPFWILGNSETLNRKKTMPHKSADVGHD